VDGFRKFLGFCVALDELLSRSTPFPLFRAAIWHYHAYWFRTKRGEVRKALEGEATRSLWNVRQIVRRLTGTSYGGILTHDEQRIRRDSAHATEILAAGRDSRAPTRDRARIGQTHMPKATNEILPQPLKASRSRRSVSTLRSQTFARCAPVAPLRLAPQRNPQNVGAGR